MTDRRRRRAYPARALGAVLVGNNSPPLIVTILLLLTLATILLPSVARAEGPSKTIVVLAQGRSGSSFLSSWFGSHPKVTYFLEPCSLVYLKEVNRDKTGTSCAAVMKQLLSCDFSSVDPKRNQKPYIPDQAVGFKGWGHQSDNDVTACKANEATAVKELRVGMAWAEKNIDFPKVVLLLRDPRAVLNSRVKGWPEPSVGQGDYSANPLGWDGRRGFPYKQSLKSLCLEHLKLRERAAKEPADRLLTVEYTDVLRDSKGLLKRVMDFAGLEIVPEVAAHVEKSTNGSCEFPDAPFSLCRSKVPLKDDKWKKELPEAKLKELLAVPECQKLISDYYPDDEPSQNDEL